MSRSRVDRLNNYGWSAVFVVCVATLLRVLWWSVSELVKQWT